MNGAGRRFHLNFGFGAIDTEAMVTRARRWIKVPAQVTSSVFVATTRYNFTKSLNDLSNPNSTFSNNLCSTDQHFIVLSKLAVQSMHIQIVVTLSFILVPSATLSMW